MRVICMTALAIAAALNAPFAHAASESDPLNVLNNMAQETVECAAYFGVMSVALENSNKPKRQSETMVRGGMADYSQKSLDYQGTCAVTLSAGNRRNSTSLEP
jgi:hypothetical protein